MTRAPFSCLSLFAFTCLSHYASVLMGWYENNCICMDSYTVAADPVWAEQTYIGDVNQILDAGFDGVKIDNCGTLLTLLDGFR